MDFMRNRIKSNSISIMGEEVKLVEDYKYLSVTWTTDWTGDNTDAVYKTGQSRFYLRKLRSFHVYSRMLHIFYKSVVESVIRSAIICWGSGTMNQ